MNKAMSTYVSAVEYLTAKYLKEKGIYYMLKKSNFMFRSKYDYKITIRFDSFDLLVKLDETTNLLCEAKLNSKGTNEFNLMGVRGDYDLSEVISLLHDLTNLSQFYKYQITFKLI